MHTIIDRHGKQGGLWNLVYSFVTLHQPSRADHGILAYVRIAPS